MEFLVIAFVTKFSICLRESAGAAELDVTDILGAACNLWLKISYKFLTNGNVSGFRWRGVR
jgi:hypothetical protein